LDASAANVAERIGRAQATLGDATSLLAARTALGAVRQVVGDADDLDASRVTSRWLVNPEKDFIALAADAEVGPALLDRLSGAREAVQQELVSVVGSLSPAERSSLRQSS
jgi:hypothetical protein